MTRTRNIGGLTHKVARLQTKALDSRRIQVVMSTEAKDRDGDVIRVAPWDLTAFMLHPVLLTSHDYVRLRSQIGDWEDVKKTTIDGQKALVGVANYYVGEGNEDADWGYNLASKGRAAYSVGFIPDLAKAKEIGDDGFWASYEFNGQELLECSHVTVPSNPEALQRIKGLAHPDLEGIIEEILAEEPPGETIDAIAERLWERIVHLAEQQPKEADPVTDPVDTDAFRAAIVAGVQQGRKELGLW